MIYLKKSQNFSILVGGVILSIFGLIDTVYTCHRKVEHHHVYVDKGGSPAHHPTHGSGYEHRHHPGRNYGHGHDHYGSHPGGHGPHPQHSPPYHHSGGYHSHVNSHGKGHPHLLQNLKTKTKYHFKGKSKGHKGKSSRGSGHYYYGHSGHKASSYLPLEVLYTIAGTHGKYHGHNHYGYGSHGGHYDDYGHSGHGVSKGYSKDYSSNNNGDYHSSYGYNSLPNYSHSGDWNGGSHSTYGYGDIPHNSIKTHEYPHNTYYDEGYGKSVKNGHHQVEVIQYHHPYSSHNKGSKVVGRGHGGREYGLSEPYPNTEYSHQEFQSIPTKNFLSPTFDSPMMDEGKSVKSIEDILKRLTSSEIPQHFFEETFARENASTIPVENYPKPSPPYSSKFFFEPNEAEISFPRGFHFTSNKNIATESMLKPPSYFQIEGPNVRSTSTPRTTNAKT